MKLMYYTGYVEMVTNRSIAHEPLKVGKKYLVKEYWTNVERNGNGGSTYSSLENYMNVYDPKTKKLLASQERVSVFVEAKKKHCKHEDNAVLDREKGIRICLGCFKKIKVKTVVEVLK